MRLLDLADRLRDAGLDVVECQSWRTRGADFPATPKVVVAHHTASPATSGNVPSLGILIDGRPDLSGPLCQIGLARNGTVYVVAAGKANHAGPGRWRDYASSEQTIGIEAENNGTGEPWPQHQLDAYDRTAAVLLDILGSPADLLCAHREWAVPTGRKIDPTGIDMRAMRTRVARLLAEGLAMPLSDKDVKRIAEAVWDHALRPAKKEGPHTARAIAVWAWANATKAAGKKVPK